MARSTQLTTNVYVTHTQPFKNKQKEKKNHSLDCRETPLNFPINSTNNTAYTEQAIHTDLFEKKNKNKKILVYYASHPKTKVYLLIKAQSVHQLQ